MERSLDALTSEVMKRLHDHQGAEFHQVHGKAFTYSIQGQTVKLSSTDQNLAPSQIRQALQRMPVEGPGALQDLRGPSYLFALLMDKRIRSGLY